MPIFYGNNKINLPGISKVSFGNNEYYKPEPPTPGGFTGLCFTAIEDNSTIKLIRNEYPVVWTGSYSLDGETWNTYNPINPTTITLDTGDKVYFKGNITGNLNWSYNYSFVMTGKIAASGNINSMYVSEGFENLTTLTYDFCFCYFFKDCTSLVTAPELPATTLSYCCYADMFNGCTSLTKAPELPATTLVDSCYADMFNGCTSLTTVPELPATTLASSCYSQMFYCCTSLVTAPELPATTLVDSCYNGMFNGCTSLTTAPDLYFKNFITEYPPETCCCNMFNGCTNLNCIKLFNYTGEFEFEWNDPFYEWVADVASSGDFYYNGSSTTRGINAIPTGWTIHQIFTGLCLTAEQANSTVKLTKTGSPTWSGSYSLDGETWSSYTSGTEITLANINDKVYFKGNITNNFSMSKYLNFVMTGKIAASGNLNSMYNGTNYTTLTTISYAYCYYQLFKNCTSLTKAPELPATTLSSNCYNSMFRGCTNLTKAPDLPATTLKSACYQDMFNGCSKLNYIKILFTGSSFGSTNFADWVANVSATGDFYYNGSSTTRGTSAIPTDWTIHTF